VKEFKELNKNVTYQLPTKWNNLDSANQLWYRGWFADQPTSVAPSLPDKQTGTDENDEWRLKSWDANLQQQVRCPAGVGADGKQQDAVTDDSLKEAVKAKRKARATQEEDKAAHRSDELVLVGSMVYLVQHKDDFRPGFMQVVVLILNIIQLIWLQLL